MYKHTGSRHIRTLAQCVWTEIIFHTECRLFIKHERKKCRDKVEKITGSKRVKDGPQLNTSVQSTSLSNVTAVEEKKVAEFGKVVTSAQWELLLLTPVHNAKPFVTHQ